MTGVAGDRHDGRAATERGGAEWTLLPWLEVPLRQALAMTRSHAILAHGSAGVGQLEFALALGRALLCESTTGPRPCGACVSCRLAPSHTHPDFAVLVPSAVREALGWPTLDSGPRTDVKPSREIRIAQVRDGIAWGQQTATRCPLKVLVIYPADALNDASASALLKTLEEPPPSLRLVLAGADPDRLLPTVRSRCQLLRLGLPASDVASDWLGSRSVAAPHALLSLSGGSPLDALAIAGEGIDAAWIADLPGRIAAGDSSPLAGRSTPRILDLLLKLVHDLGCVAVGGTPRFYPAQSLPRTSNPAALHDWQRELFRVARHPEHPWHAPLLVEALVVAGRRVWHAPVAPVAGRRARASLHSPS